MLPILELIWTTSTMGSYAPLFVCLYGHDQKSLETFDCAIVQVSHAQKFNNLRDRLKSSTSPSKGNSLQRGWRVKRFVHHEFPFAGDVELLRWSLRCPIVCYGLLHGILVPPNSTYFRINPQTS